MPTHTGSCHCGRVTFEVTADITNVVECTCSICRKKGALHFRAELEQVHITAGKDVLSIYQFNTKTAQHYFCRTCGIQTFSHSRLAPDKWTVNVRCLDGLDIASLKISSFDGEHWEEAAKALRGH